MTRHTTRVDFSRSGLKQLIQMNRTLGSRFVRGIVLRHDLSIYITAHEQQGVSFDTICQELHYGDGIYLLLMRTNGIWIITDIWYSGAPDAYEPVYLWQRIRRGYHTLAIQVLACWRSLTMCPYGPSTVPHPQ